MHNRYRPNSIAGLRCVAALVVLFALMARAEQQSTPNTTERPKVRSISEALRLGLAQSTRSAIGQESLRTSSDALELPAQTKPEGQRFRMGADSFSSGFEAPCTPGYIGGGSSGVPQNCEWRASNNVQMSATQPVIANSNPFAGDQHLHLEFDPGQPSGIENGARNWAFSENIPNAPLGGVMSLKMQLYISDLGGLNNYRIHAQAPGAASAIMWFMPTGEIVVFEDLVPNDGELDGFFTQFSWVPGEYKSVSICVDAVNDRIRYFYDGDLIWSTGAGEGGQGTGVFGDNPAVVTMSQVVIRYEDNQNDSTFMDVDDVVIEPGNCTLPTGACCNIDGAGACERTSESACAASGTGLYGGDNRDCSVGLCAGLEVCGQKGDVSCFDAAGSTEPGCAEFECCIDVCTLNPACCEVSWTSACASLALEECSVLCASDDTQCQTAGVLDAFNSTFGEFQVADNFTPANSGTISSVCWSGVYLDNPFIEDSFTIRYYECRGGVPGDLLGEFSEASNLLAVTGKEDSGLDLAGSFDIFEYTAVHPEVAVVAGEVYFIEISNAPPGGDAWFWEIADLADLDGDGVFFQKPHGDGYARHYQGCRFDLAFCVNTELGPLGGLCELIEPPSCVAPLSIPKGAISEDEACGAATNNECASAMPISVSHFPTNPTFVVGQAFADSGMNDEDWYVFNVADLNGDSEAILCVTIVAELPMQSALVQDIGGNCVEEELVEDLVQAVSLPCNPSREATYVVDAPGQFMLRTRVADGCDVLQGYPCPNNYVLELAVADSAAECFSCGLFSCPADFDRNKRVDSADLADLLATWGDCPALGPCCADLVTDGTVDSADLADVLAGWGPCTLITGACCDVDGLGNCAVISDDACAGAGGLFLGTESLCEDCPPASCGLGAGDCCAANGTAGCEQMDCCSAVCAADPSCCSGSWTSACATQAESLCPACAPPPPNDECASSIAIVDGPTEFDTSTATTDGPAHMEECQFDGQTYNDIWFDYTATCTGNLTVSTCNQSDYDTDLVVYDGCQCPVGEENLLGCNDDTSGCALFSSELTVGVAADSCYKIRVGGFSAGDSGTGTVSVTCSP